MTQLPLVYIHEPFPSKATLVELCTWLHLAVFCRNTEWKGGVKKKSKTHLLNNHAYLSTRSHGTHTQSSWLAARWQAGRQAGMQAGGQANREWAGWRYNPEPLKANKDQAQAKHWTSPSCSKHWLSEKIVVGGAPAAPAQDVCQGINHLVWQNISR